MNIKNFESNYHKILINHKYNIFLFFHTFSYIISHYFAITKYASFERCMFNILHIMYVKHHPIDIVFFSIYNTL